MEKVSPRLSPANFSCMIMKTFKTIGLYPLVHIKNQGHRLECTCTCVHVYICACVVLKFILEFPSLSTGNWSRPLPSSHFMTAKVVITSFSLPDLSLHPDSWNDTLDEKYRLLYSRSKIINWRFQSDGQKLKGTKQLSSRKKYVV